MPFLPKKAGDELPLAETLTRSEIRCLSLTAQGDDIAAIARKMSMARREIEMLLYCAERKLNAKNRLHAICVAASLDILDTEI